MTAHLQSSRLWWRSIHVSSSGPGFRKSEWPQRTLLIINLISLLQVRVSPWIIGPTAEVIISNNTTGTTHSASAMANLLAGTAPP
jgi:hypothetical protein